MCPNLLPFRLILIFRNELKIFKILTHIILHKRSTLHELKFYLLNGIELFYILHHTLKCRKSIFYIISVNFTIYRKYFYTENLGNTSIAVDVNGEQ